MYFSSRVKSLTDNICRVSNHSVLACTFAPSDRGERDSREVQSSVDLHFQTVGKQETGL